VDTSFLALAKIRYFQTIEIYTPIFPPNKNFHICVYKCRFAKQKIRGMSSTVTRIYILLFIAAMSITKANAQVNEPPKGAFANMKTEEFTYTTAGVSQKGYTAYIPNERNKLPIVLVVPEWWGYDDYVKSRARQLAELGYFAIVVDMYGDGKEAKTPDEAKKLSGPFYSDPALAKARLQAAEDKAKSYPMADPRRVAVIGYCFGGTMALFGATQGMDFKATVSFHGGLKGVTAAKDAVKGKILICHGANDKFTTEADLATFRKDMDKAGVRYFVKIYPGASHAFTNPAATENGKKFNLPIAYNEAADKASWQDMRHFLREVFYSK
jgi:dienelactone hydrolase